MAVGRRGAVMKRRARGLKKRRRVRDGLGGGGLASGTVMSEKKRSKVLCRYERRSCLRETSRWGQWLERVRAVAGG